MGSIEQRRFARLETSLECTVMSDDTEFRARVVNLSRSGAGLVGPVGFAEVGANLILLLERSEGGFSLALPSQVVRVTPRPEDSVYGVDFVVVPPDVQDELTRLLKALTLEKGQGRRDSPRVAARVKVRCKSRGAFVAQLNDLSRGGLSVKNGQELEPGSPLTVQFGVETSPSLLTVSGEVLRSTPSDGAWMVSLKFDPPTEDDRAQVLLLLDVLLGITPHHRPGVDD
jgi:PilZ domain